MEYASDTDWFYDHEVECIVCPECSFTFAAEHTDVSGGYSCPACVERRLRSERDALRERVEVLEGALREIYGLMDESNDVVLRQAKEMVQDRTVANHLGCLSDDLFHISMLCAHTLNPDREGGGDG